MSESPVYSLRDELVKALANNKTKRTELTNEKIKSESLERKLADAMREKQLLEIENKSLQVSALPDPHFCVPVVCLEVALLIYSVVDIGLQVCEWPDGLHSFRQVTQVKLSRVRSNSGWMTSRRHDLTTHLVPHRPSEGTLNLRPHSWMWHA